jgi:hypothetical protein
MGSQHQSMHPTDGVDAETDAQITLRELRLLEGLSPEEGRNPKDPTVVMRRPDPGAIQRWIAQQELASRREPESQHPALRALLAER